MFRNQNITDNSNTEGNKLNYFRLILCCFEHHSLKLLRKGNQIILAVIRHNNQKHQAESLGQIGQGIEQLSSVVQGNAASSEENTAISINQAAGSA